MDLVTYQTSPLLCFVPGIEHYKLFIPKSEARCVVESQRLIDILTFFLEAKSLREARSAGFSDAELNEAIAHGCLLAADDPNADSLMLWEERNWTRSGFLTFSQVNLPYDEPAPSETRLEKLTDARRERIAGYNQHAPYPAARTPPCGAQLLPKFESGKAPIAWDLDNLIKRRSVREFTSAAITTDQLASILWQSTDELRFAESTRETGDPYFILNSYFSWLRVFVVVQGVRGFDRGAYEYFPIEHALAEVRANVSDSQIIECVQGQSWLKGGGVVLFVVADWERYRWIYRHSRAYLNLLIQVGEFSQSVLQSAAAFHLGGWCTPAVNESLTARILGLDTTTSEALFFIKIGPPKLPLEER